jgi:tetratricopeptide (TPR) repeat protein
VHSFTRLLTRGFKGAGRILLSPFVLVKEYPWRVLGGLTLLLVLATVGTVLGVYFWAYHQLESARTSLIRGHNLVAIQHLQSCRPILSDKPEWQILSARAARRAGALNEAELLLDRYWKIRGDDDALVTERLLLRATQGEIEEVRSQLNLRIEANDSSAPMAREALIVGLMYRFGLSDAREELDRWLNQDPEHPIALFLSGKVAEMREETSVALLSYRHCLKNDPEYDEARLRLAAVLLMNREGEEALPHIEYLRKRYPDNPDVLVKFAQALDLLRRGNEAREVLNDCLRRNPDHSEALTERGRIALRDGDGTTAEDDLGKAVAVDPGNFVAHYQLLLALKENGKTAEATREQETIARMEADIARLRDLIKDELARNPNDPEPYYEIAMISMRAGRPKEGLRWLKNALEIDPTHEPSHRSLAAYYYETGNPILSARHRAIAQQLAERKKR